jgi:plastocyanin
MRIQLLSFVCIGGLLATGLLLWNQSARAADNPKTINIVLGPSGPKFAEETVTISAGQSITWVPKTKSNVPHHLVQIMPNGDDGPNMSGDTDFFAPEPRTHKFGTPGDFKIQCTHHRTSMNQTITVTP